MLLTSLNIPKSACVVCRPSQQLAGVPYYQLRLHVINLHAFQLTYKYTYQHSLTIIIYVVCQLS